MKRSREWLPRLLVESVVVILSILLALAANEWWKGRETEARVERSLRSIRSELQRNRNTIRDAADYHAGLADTLRTLAQQGVARVEDDVYPRGWLIAPELLSAAWRAAAATGTTAEMPHEIVLDLSQAYHEQSLYLQRRESIIPVLYGSLLRGDGASFAERYRTLTGIISDVAGWESSLLEEYDGALKRLDGTLEE